MELKTLSTEGKIHIHTAETAVLGGSGTSNKSRHTLGANPGTHPGLGAITIGSNALLWSPVVAGGRRNRSNLKMAPLALLIMAFLVMTTHMDAARSTQTSPQIQNDDPSSMLRNTGFNRIGLCDWRGNRNTRASCIQNTALVEKAPNSQHRGPNRLLGLEQKHRCPGRGM